MNITLAGIVAVRINGISAITATDLRLVVNGDSARTDIVFCVPQDGPEFDVADLRRSPATVEINAGVFGYRLDEAVAVAYSLTESSLESETLTGDNARGDVSLTLSFTSRKVALVATDASPGIAAQRDRIERHQVHKEGAE